MKCTICKTEMKKPAYLNGKKVCQACFLRKGKLRCTVQDYINKLRSVKV